MKIRPDPAAFAVNNALPLKLGDGSLAALDSRHMMRVFRGLLIPGLRKRNGLHIYS
jgi:hypothetical protein